MQIFLRIFRNLLFSFAKTSVEKASLVRRNHEDINIVPTCQDKLEI